MDTIFYLEIAIVAIIIIAQFLVFTRNTGAISRLGNIFPDSQELDTEPLSITEQNELSGTEQIHLKQVAEQEDYHPIFKEIIQTTNSYLAQHKKLGTLDTLKEMAERKVAILERAVESNITLPLYIGLLCTFTGVIIGLVKIAMVGVSDVAIQTFIGGVLIGMVGSAIGLALTVRSNYQMKNAKKTLDQQIYDYFTFLRTHILPSLQVQTETSTQVLKKNLSAFHEGFVQYQDHVNESLGDSVRLFSELKELTGQIKQIEQGLNGVGRFLQSNDGMISKQLEYIDVYAKRAEALTQKLNRSIGYADDQLERLVEEGTKALNSRTQIAYAQVDHYLSMGANGSGSYNGNGSTAVHSVGNGGLEVHSANGVNLDIQQQLLEKMSLEDKSQQAINHQLKQINTRLAQALLHQDTHFLNSREFRLFVYAGAASFLVGLAGGVIHIINTFAG